MLKLSGRNRESARDYISSIYSLISKSFAMQLPIKFVVNLKFDLKRKSRKKDILLKLNRAWEKVL